MIGVRLAGTTAWHAAHRVRHQQPNRRRGWRLVAGPTKRHPRAEPVHDPAASPLLSEGIDLFNAGKHWHAHEAWEQLWLGLEGDEKRFVQGLIMAAAMLHQYKRGVVRGVVNHHQNVLERVSAHAPERWGIDVQGLLAQLARFAEAAGREPPDLDLDADRVRIVRHASGK